MRRGNLEVAANFKTVIAELIPNRKTRLLRLRLAMTAKKCFAVTLYSVGDNYPGFPAMIITQGGMGVKVK